MHTVAKRKVSVGAMVLSIPMLFFAGLTGLIGSYHVWEWGSESLVLMGTAVVLTVASATAVLCAFWILGSLGRSQRAQRLGGTAIVVSGIVLAAAAAIHVIPCSGPA